MPPDHARAFGPPVVGAVLPDGHQPHGPDRPASPDILIARPLNSGTAGSNTRAYAGVARGSGSAFGAAIVTSDRDEAA